MFTTWFATKDIQYTRVTIAGTCRGFIRVRGSNVKRAISPKSLLLYYFNFNLTPRSHRAGRRRKQTVCGHDHAYENEK